MTSFIIDFIGRRIRPLGDEFELPKWQKRNFSCSLKPCCNKTWSISRSFDI